MHDTNTAASLLATELYFRRRNFSPVQKEFQKCIVSLMVFENHRKSRIQHCERSGLRLHFEWIKKAKNGQFGEFLNPRDWSQTVLPGRSD